MRPSGSVCALEQAVGPDLGRRPAHRVDGLGQVALGVVDVGRHPAQRVGLLRDLVESRVVLIRIVLPSGSVTWVSSPSPAPYW